MLRTIAVRNQWLYRKSVKKLTCCATRLLCIYASRNLAVRSLQGEVLSSSLFHQKIWGVNYVRGYSTYPPHTKVALPALSPTMESGSIVSWEKKEGDKVNEGDLLAEIETDKATMGFETPEEGYVAKIMIPAGTKDVPIGKLVCIIVQNQADVAAFKDYKDDDAGPSVAASAPPPPPPVTPPTPTPQAVAPPTPPPMTPSPAPAPAPTIVTQPSAPSPTAGAGDARVYVSPMAKRLAEAQQLRLQGRGSGVHGSIKSSDIKEKAAQPPSTSDNKYIDIPLSNIRSIIAKRLLESKQQIPHYYVSVECEMDNLLKLRSQINKKHDKEGVKVSVNDFIIKATATACRKVPEANSYWMGNIIRQFENVDVSVAVSTDTGLITPIVFKADTKGIIEISKEIKELAKRARENKLKPQEFQGGTVCVSNLGMFGVTHFCAVINPPQSCILAIGGTTKKLVIDPNDKKEFKEINVMTVTLSADHRVVDGAVAARWLQYFRDYMQDPATMIF